MDTFAENDAKRTGALRRLSLGGTPDRESGALFSVLERQLFDIHLCSGRAHGRTSTVPASRNRVGGNIVLPRDLVVPEKGGDGANCNPGGTPEQFWILGRFAKSLILLVELVRIELTTS